VRGYTNLSVTEERFGNLVEVEDLQLKCLEVARRVGDREGEWFALGNLTTTYLETAKWDETMEIVRELPPGLETQALGLHANVSEIARHRGDIELARVSLERAAGLADSASLQDRSVYISTRAALLYAEGRYDEIITELENARMELEADTGSVWLDLLIAEAALAGGRVDRAAEALASEALGQQSTGPIIHAQATSFRAQVSAARGEGGGAEEGFKQAAAAFREYGTPFYLACTELEHAEWLVAAGRADEAAPLVAEARETFERLRATPWLERADALASRFPAPAATLA
jgi:ATP/maltotriose-dependent transcriptional regulator MalT